MTNQPDRPDEPAEQTPPQPGGTPAAPPQTPAQAGATPVAPPVDPWRGFRAVMAATLILEAIVVLLALPVVGAVGGGLTSGSLVFLIGLAVLLLALAGLQGHSWAIWVNLAVQALPIAGFVVYPGVGFMGVLFAAVWVLIVYFRAEVRSRQQRGLLPGQQQPPD